MTPIFPTTPTLDAISQASFNPNINQATASTKGHFDVYAFSIKDIASITNFDNAIPLSEVKHPEPATIQLLEALEETRPYYIKAKSMTDFCELIRSHPGFSKSVLKRLRIFPSDNLTSILRHLYATSYLTKLIDHQIIDIESAGCPHLSGKFDLVSLNTKTNVYWLWDLTSDPKLVQEKLKALSTEASSTGLSKVVVAVSTFKLKRVNMVNDFPSRISGKTLRDGLDSVSIAQSMGRKLLKFKDYDSSYQALNDIYFPLLKSKLDNLYLNAERESVESKAKLVLQNSDLDFEHFIENNYETKGADFATFWKIVKRDYPEFHDEFQSLIDNIELKVDNLGVPIPVPMSCSSIREADVLFQVACKADPISWGIFCINNPSYLPDLVAKADIIGLTLDGEFTIDTELLPKAATFNHKQNSLTKVHNELIVAFKKVYKVVRCFTHNGEDFTYVSKNKAIESAELKGIPADKIIRKKIQTTGAQILVNLDNYNDHRFSKMISRNDPHEDKTDTTTEENKSEIESTIFSKQYERSNQNIFSRLADDDRRDIMKPGFNFFDKTKLILDLKAPRVLQKFYDSCSDKVNSPMLRRFLFQYELSKSMSHTFIERSKPNFIVLSNLGNIPGVLINFVNKGVYGFTNTWYKEIIVSEQDYALFGEGGSRTSSTIKCTPSFRNYGYRQDSVPLLDPKNSTIGYANAMQWKSINTNHLQWLMDAGPKVVSKLAALYEMRHDFYENFPDIASREMAFTSLPFFVNRQQFSIVCNAQRFLHGSLSSSHAKHGAPIAKLKGMRIKSDIEMVYLGNMITTYLVSRLLMLANRTDEFMTRDGSAFTVMPDLLHVSSNPHLNVSSYSTYTFLNPDKAERNSAESECVRNLKDQLEDLKYATNKHPDFVRGMSEVLANEILTSDEPLSHIIVKNKETIADYARSLFDYDNTEAFASDMMFQLCTLLDVRLNTSEMKSIFDMESIDITKYFTTRGSIITEDFDEAKDNKSKRRASAMVYLMGKILGRDLTEMNEDDLDLTFDTMSIIYALAREENRLEIYPNIQLSEKDAPGKDREISTLHITYGMSCQLTEEMIRPVSDMMPEDIINDNNKDKTVDEMIARVNSKRSSRNKECKESLFASTDKSKFGPNVKTSTWLLNAVALSPDESTFEFFNRLAQSSAVRKTRFPHQILSNSIYVKTTSGTKVKRTTRPGNGAFADARTGEIMNFIYELNESSGKSYLNIPEGMPGQGIFGISCSVAHSAMMRYISKVARTRDWEMDTVVTSDDSMYAITLLSKDKAKMKDALPRFIASTLSLGGLIENMGKYILSNHQAEMNQIYNFKGEPVVPVIKFSSAFVQPKLTANYTEDLLGSVTRGADLIRKGACLFSATWVAAVNMTVIIDAHRQWRPLLEHAVDLVRENKRFTRNLWNLPVELFGIPNLDLQCGIIGGSASKLATFANVLRSDLALPLEEKISIDDFMSNQLVSSYTKSLALTAFELPRLDNSRAIGDTQMPLEENGVKTIAYETESGKIERRAVINKYFFPSETGVRGRMKESSNDHKLANELGPNFVSSNLTNHYDSRTVRGIFSVIKRSLSSPIASGETTLKGFQALHALNHTHNYKYMTLEPSSPMNPLAKSFKISKREIVAALLDKSYLDRIFECFKQRITIKGIEFDKLEGDIAWPILRDLKEFYDTLLRLQLMSENGRLKTNPAVRNERLRKEDRYRTERKKLVKLNKSIKSGIGLSGARSIVASRIFTNEDINKLTIAERHELGVLGLNCTGTIEGLAVYDVIELCAQRLIARIPKPVQLYANQPSFEHIFGFNDIAEYMSRNTFEGHILSFDTSMTASLKDFQFSLRQHASKSLFSRKQIQLDIASWALGGNVAKTDIDALTPSKILRRDKFIDNSKLHRLMTETNGVIITTSNLSDYLSNITSSWAGYWKVRYRVEAHDIKLTSDGISAGKTEKVYHITEHKNSLVGGLESEVFTHVLVVPYDKKRFLSNMRNQLLDISSNKYLKQVVDKLYNPKFNRKAQIKDKCFVIDGTDHISGRLKLHGTMLVVETIDYAIPLKKMSLPAYEIGAKLSSLSMSKVKAPKVKVIKMNPKKALSTIKYCFVRMSLNPEKNFRELMKIKKETLRKHIKKEALTKMIATLGAYRPPEGNLTVVQPQAESDIIFSSVANHFMRNVNRYDNNPIMWMLRLLYSIFGEDAFRSTGHGLQASIKEKGIFNLDELGHEIIKDDMVTEYKQNSKLIKLLETTYGVQNATVDEIDESASPNKESERNVKNLKVVDEVAEFTDKGNSIIITDADFQAIHNVSESEREEANKMLREAGLLEMEDDVEITNVPSKEDNLTSEMEMRDDDLSNLILAMMSKTNP